MLEAVYRLLGAVDAAEYAMTATAKVEHHEQAFQHVRESARNLRAVLENMGQGRKTTVEERQRIHPDLTDEALKGGRTYFKDVSDMLLTVPPQCREWVCDRQLELCVERKPDGSFVSRGVNFLEAYKQAIGELRSQGYGVYRP